MAVRNHLIAERTTVRSMRMKELGTNNSYHPMFLHFLNC